MPGEVKSTEAEGWKLCLNLTLMITPKSQRAVETVCGLRLHSLVCDFIEDEAHRTVGPAAAAAGGNLTNWPRTLSSRAGLALPLAGSANLSKAGSSPGPRQL